MNTEPIDVTTRAPLFRHAPRLVLFAGYLLSLSVLIGASSTWFIPTKVSVQTSGTLTAHVTALQLASPALMITRQVEKGARVEVGQHLLDYTTDTQRLAEASLGYQLRATLAELTRDPAQSDARLTRQLQGTLAMLSVGGQSLAAPAPAKGWLLAPLNEHTQASPDDPVIIPAGQPLLEVGTDETLTLKATLSSDSFPGTAVEGPIHVLLADFGGEDILGTLKSQSATASFEFPLKQFTAEQLARLEQSTTTRVRMFEIDLPATPVVNTQSLGLTILLDPLPSVTHSEIKSRRNAELLLPEYDNKTLKTKWGGITAQVSIELPGASLSPVGKTAFTEALHEGQRSVAIASCWIQTDTRKLFWRLFGS